jgi:hypothetical protein
MGYIFNCQPLSGYPIGTEWTVNVVNSDHVDATATLTGEVVTLTGNQFESYLRYAERD